MPVSVKYQDERLEESSRLRQAANARQSVDRSRAECTYPLASGVVAVRLGTVSRLDHIGFKADWARPAVQLEEQAASVAQDEAIFIAAPKRRGARRAILANGLYDENDELAMVAWRRCAVRLGVKADGAGQVHYR